MDGGREGGVRGKKKTGWSDECWSGKMGRGGQTGGGGRRNESMSGTMAEQKHKGRGSACPRVDVKRGGWREQWRNNEQAGPL